MVWTSDSKVNTVLVWRLEKFGGYCSKTQPLI